MLTRFLSRPDALRLLTLTAAILMLLPLPIMQYVGEEGLMAIKSYEMFVRDDWLHPSIFGMVWPHSPLWHWPVIGLCLLFGWEHVDIAIRLVSVFSTWAGAVVAGMAARWLFPAHRNVAWLAALIYLSLGETCFWYGWLGYVDAMFGMFIFASIMALWRYLECEHPAWLTLSLLAISLAFLTKNITAYVLYGAAGFVLLWQLGRWQALGKATNILGLVLALSVPALWQLFVIQHGGNTATTTLNDALRNFIGFGLLDYLKHWITFPLIFLLRAFPMTLFLLWLWWFRKQSFEFSQPIRTLGLIILVCLLPFWVSANGTPRYLLPLYGFVSLMLTGLMLQLEPRRLMQGLRLIAIVLMLKIPYSLVVLPGIKDWLPERDVVAVAKDIMSITGDTKVYTRNDVATGLAIAAYIDVWRQDKAPITWYRGQKPPAYVLAEAESPKLGKLVRSWRLRGDRVFLYQLEGSGAR
ncbi:MAG: hypothetical protein D6790_21310 [Caldilineae bacterium]|nr:MAG: hypothetical protein D6790_21310 [Caldilineae bacterium]